jgi:hypothetical protein
MTFAVVVPGAGLGFGFGRGTEGEAQDGEGQEALELLLEEIGR